MLGMNNNGDAVVDKQFIITRKVIMIEYHTVDADTRAEAIRMVENGSVEDYET